MGSCPPFRCLTDMSCVAGRTSYLDPEQFNSSSSSLLPAPLFVAPRVIRTITDNSNLGLLQASSFPPPKSIILNLNNGWATAIPLNRLTPEMLSLPPGTFEQKCKDLAKLAKETESHEDESLEAASWMKAWRNLVSFLEKYLLVHTDGQPGGTGAKEVARRWRTQFEMIENRTDFVPGFPVYKNYARALLSQFVAGSQFNQEVWQSIIYEDEREAFREKRLAALERGSGRPSDDAFSRGRQENSRVPRQDTKRTASAYPASIYSSSSHLSRAWNGGDRRTSSVPSARNDRSFRSEVSSGKCCWVCGDKDHLGNKHPKERPGPILSYSLSSKCWADSNNASLCIAFNIHGVCDTSSCPHAHRCSLCAGTSAGHYAQTCQRRGNASS